MATEIASIEEHRSRKLKELFYLFSNPLQSLDTFKKLLLSSTARQFFRANDISLGNHLQVLALPRVHDYESLKREITNTVQAELYLTGDKRESDGSEGGPRKQQKTTFTDYPSRLMPAGQGHKRKESGVTSLRSQVDVLEQETNGFLNKSISDLDILSLPEHYPTEVHNVSSLAELYYLTQTLPLIKLLPGSHKTLITEDFELALLEGKIGVLYSRIEELKRQKKWSLRQPLRYYDPFLYSKRNKKAKSYHWDTLLNEARWLATDFKELSKFKKACCFEMAQAVQDYWTYGKIMCIKRKPIRHIGEYEDTETDDPLGLQGSDSKIENSVGVITVVDLRVTTDTVADAEVSEKPNIGESGATSAEVDQPATQDTETVKAENEDDMEIDQSNQDPEDLSSAIMDAPASEETPELDNTPEIEQGTEEPEAEEPETIDITKLLERPDPNAEIEPPELPQYTAEDLAKLGVSVTSNSPFKLHVNVNDIKKIDQSIIRNLPKFTAFDDDLVSNLQHPPLKPSETSIVPVSRMLYPFDQDDDWYKIVLKDAGSDLKSLQEPQGPPEFQKGLFGVLALRRFNFLRPPKPPLIKNIEFRSPTIWLPQDDKYLIHYVAEYCFNWDLIAENLLAHSSTLKRYESNIECRTPWQCFERYIQLNEKFQFADMKGHNAYLAQQWLEQAHKAQLTTKRRISPLGVGNESIQRGHRKLRWASMFDAMRKTMRKRETHAAKANSRRSTNSLSSELSSQGLNASFSNGTTPVKRPNDRIPTPGELSKLKFDRDKTIQEAYMNQQLTRSRMAAAVSQLKQGTASAGSESGSPAEGMRRTANIPGRTQLTGTALTNLQQPQATPGQQQQGKPLIGNIKRPTTPNGTPLTVEQIQQLLQIQKQRRLMQQQNQEGKTGIAPGSSSISLQGTRKLTGTSQIGVGQNFAGGPMATGSSSSANPQTVGQARKAGVPPVRGRLQFAPGQVSSIINSIQQKNPNLTKEQVTKLAASYLANLQQQQQNRLEQQQQQQGRTQNLTQQQTLLARQAQLQRQRLAQGKEPETQSLLKMQYEERKKLMMQGTQLPAAYATGASSQAFNGANSGAGNASASPQPTGRPTGMRNASRQQQNNSEGS